jgi:ATP-dependent Lon protease
MSDPKPKETPVPASQPEEGGSLNEIEALQLPSRLPVIAIDNSVLFPFMIAPIVVSQEHDKALIDDVLKADRLVGVFLKKQSGGPDIFENLHDTGCLAVILKMLRMPDGAVRILLHGLERVKIVDPLSEEPYLVAGIERLVFDTTSTRPIQALMKSIQQMMLRVVEMANMPQDLATAVSSMEDPGRLADLVITHLPIKVEERQAILETPGLEPRLHRVLEILSREADLLQLSSEIQSEVSQRIDKSQRDYMLREQIKAIRKELGEDDKQNPEILELRAAIEKANLPTQPKETAEKEVRRLEMMHPSSPEYSVSRNYLDWILALPWNESTRDNIDIQKARAVLDEDHFGLEDVKERILECLAVIQLRKEVRGPILCFVGPPGVGKTSLGRSIARAMGRKFYRMSLGGMRDEAEIRGHRRTYIGALPGRILKGIKDCGSNNPLIMLDEVDKLGTDFRGDPASALLEVLDPEQNSTFTDHYLDMPFDLSKVMFITTANLLDPIPTPLLDRMEVLRLSGYTTREKLEIATRYLVPRAYENTGVREKHIRFTPEGIQEIAENYTREAGVRNLEREITNICRKMAKKIASGDKESVVVRPERVQEMLGPARVHHEMADRTGLPGVAIGLAWTQTGGEILFIEVNSTPGTGQLTLTGQLGNVMKESAMAAMDYLHANAQQLGIPEKAFARQNFHLHIPAGATPKDGPSAGIAIACAFCSLLADVPVRENLACTGEITLKGNVLAVGGIKEKVIAAHRSGVREIILPARCKEELLKDVPQEVRDALQFHYADHISQVLDVAFPALKEVRQHQEPEAIPVRPVAHPALPQPRPHQPAPKPVAEERERIILPPEKGNMVSRPPLVIQPDPEKAPKPHQAQDFWDEELSAEDEAIASESVSETEEEAEAETPATSSPLSAEPVAGTSAERPGEGQPGAGRKSRRRKRGRRSRPGLPLAEGERPAGASVESQPAVPMAAAPESVKPQPPVEGTPVSETRSPEPASPVPAPAAGESPTASESQPTRASHPSRRETQGRRYDRRFDRRRPGQATAASTRGEVSLLSEVRSIETPKPESAPAPQAAAPSTPPAMKTRPPVVTEKPSRPVATASSGDSPRKPQAVPATTATPPAEAPAAKTPVRRTRKTAVKTVAEKEAVEKPAAAPKKTTVKRTVKKVAAKTATKTPAEKTAAKTVKKTAVKKTVVKKETVKKTTRKTVVKKTVAKKATKD